MSSAENRAMRTESGRQGPGKDFSRSRVSALMPQHSVLCFTLCAMLLALCVTVLAQQPVKIPRIGYFDGGFASTNAERVDAFRQGLRELGYVEGKNIVVEYRHSERNLDRLPRLVAELLRLKVDVI